MVEQECGPTRDPPQSVSIDIGLRIENDGGPDAADDMEDVSRGQSVSEIDNSRNTNVAQEQRPRIVVPVLHERDYALGHSSQPELKAVAHHAFKYQALLGVAMTTPCEVGLLAARLQELTRKKSPRYSTRTISNCLRKQCGVTQNTWANSDRSRRS